MPIYIFKLGKDSFYAFYNKNNYFSNFDIIYTDKKLTTVDSEKFVGLTLDNSLSWINNIEAIIPKMSAPTFARIIVQPFMSLDPLKLIYSSYFHSILTYRIIFWGNTHHSMQYLECERELSGSWWE